LVIGFPLLVLVSIAALVLTIIAGIKANEGQAYRYPFAWRLEIALRRYEKPAFSRLLWSR
jgi:hypothetical protein